MWPKLFKETTRVVNFPSKCFLTQHMLLWQSKDWFYWWQWCIHSLEHGVKFKYEQELEWERSHSDHHTSLNNNKINHTAERGHIVMEMHPWMTIKSFIEPSPLCTCVTHLKEHIFLFNNMNKDKVLEWHVSPEDQSHSSEEGATPKSACTGSTFGSGIDFKVGTTTGPITEVDKMWRWCPPKLIKKKR